MTTVLYYENLDFQYLKNQYAYSNGSLSDFI